MTSFIIREYEWTCNTFKPYTLLLVVVRFVYQIFIDNVYSNLFLMNTITTGFIVELIKLMIISSTPIAVSYHTISWATMEMNVLKEIACREL